MSKAASGFHPSSKPKAISKAVSFSDEDYDDSTGGTGGSSFSPSGRAAVNTMPDSAPKTLTKNQVTFDGS